jgi:hypothetical protein
MSRTLVSALILLALGGGVRAQQVPPIVPTGDLPLTVAEQSGYTRTATYEDVWAWLEMLAGRSPDLKVEAIGTTTEGRRMPLVIASRPLITDPEQARRTGKPILYIQGNIHAGEVEGKDALLMLLRDLTLGDARGLLDKVILLVNPLYNPDGNEKWAPVARNRPGQDGPEEVGQRPNGMGLDLNRDYIKTEAPETRRTLEAVVNPWSPDLYMDLHTTNGSYHGYDLTYAPCNTPTAPRATVLWTKQVLIPQLRARLAGHGHPIFDYGNFDRGTPPTTWTSFGWEPMYGTNYMGTRGMVSILSEAVSYRPFRTRVSATYWLLRETIALAGADPAPMLQRTRRGGTDFEAWAADPAKAPPLGVRYEAVSRGKEVVNYEIIEPAPGGGRGRGTRTGRLAEAEMDILTEYRATLERPFPAGYLIPVAYPEAVQQLLRHGIRVERLKESWTGTAAVFRADTLAVRRPYQGHRQIDLQGTWSEAERTAAAGWYWVPAGQPLGGLLFLMLEPESPDGLVSWNFFDRGITQGRAGVAMEVPILKLMATPRVAREPVTGPVYR